MSKRYIIMGGCLVMVALVIVALARLYPVAIVNGSPIWYRTWNRYLLGSSHALVLRARSQGTQFNPDATLVSVIRKNMLTALIEDKIIIQEARKLIPDFDGISDMRVHKVIGSAADIEKAALFMYGFTAADFQKFILLPQSHREVIQNELEKQKINVPAWFAGIKKKAHVRLMLHSYTWNGDTLVDTKP